MQPIYKFAFYSCDKLRNITIPESVISIGDNAFTLCSSMNIDVYLPNVENIYDGAFSFSGIKSFKADNCLSIGNGCFEQCMNLKTVKLDLVENIYSGAFLNCNALESVDISTGVMDDINPDTFSGCYNLTTVLLPFKLEKIWGGAFKDCYSLRELWIPKTVDIIGDSAFERCKNLTIYSDSEYVNDFCEEHEIKCLPANVYKGRTESFNRPKRLRIKEM